MNLKVTKPTKIVLDKEVIKIKARAHNGAFEFLPRHIDFLSSLPPGIVEYQTPEGNVGYVAVNEALLVKVGPTVMISTSDAADGAQLGRLREKIQENYLKVSDSERKAKTAVYNIESEIMKKFIELE